MVKKKNNIPEIGKKINRSINTLKRNPSKIYFLLFFLYFFGLATFLFINLTKDNEISIEEYAINETVKLNDNPITLVSRTINKKKNLVKIAFYYDNNTRSELQNMDLNFNTIAFSNTDFTLKSKVIRATENYYVVFLNNVPEDFGALSTTITEDKNKLNSSLSSEIIEKNSNDSSENSTEILSVKVRGLEESFEIDNNLKVENKTYYAKESVDYEIELNDQLINEYEDNILSLTDENLNIDIDIEKINAEIPYELEEKIPDLEKEIITFEEKKIENKTEIKKITNQIEETKDQIELQKNKKNDIK